MRMGFRVWLVPVIGLYDSAFMRNGGSWEICVPLGYRIESVAVIVVPQIF